MVCFHMLAFIFYKALSKTAFGCRTVPPSVVWIPSRVLYAQPGRNGIQKPFQGRVFWWNILSPSVNGTKVNEKIWNRGFTRRAWIAGGADNWPVHGQWKSSSIRPKTMVWAVSSHIIMNDTCLFINILLLVIRNETVLGLIEELFHCPRTGQFSAPPAIHTRLVKPRFRIYSFTLITIVLMTSLFHFYDHKVYGSPFHY